MAFYGEQQPKDMEGEQKRGRGRPKSKGKAKPSGVIMLDPSPSKEPKKDEEEQEDGDGSEEEDGDGSEEEDGDGGDGGDGCEGEAGVEEGGEEEEAVADPEVEPEETGARGSSDPDPSLISEYKNKKVVFVLQRGQELSTLVVPERREARSIHQHCKQRLGSYRIISMNPNAKVLPITEQGSLHTARPIEMMKVFVAFGRESKELEVMMSQTVNQLKIRAMESLEVRKIAPRELMLFKLGEEAFDGRRSIKSCGIKDGDTLRLGVKGRAGGKAVRGVKKDTIAKSSCSMKEEKIQEMMKKLGELRKQCTTDVHLSIASFNAEVDKFLRECDNNPEHLDTVILGLSIEQLEAMATVMSSTNCGATRIKQYSNIIFNNILENIQEKVDCMLSCRESLESVFWCRPQIA